MAVVNFPSAALRHAESAVPPEPSALSQHFNLAPIFFDAAFVLAAAHLCAGVPAAWTSPALTTSRASTVTACPIRRIGYSPLFRRGGFSFATPARGIAGAS